MKYNFAEMALRINYFAEKVLTIRTDKCGIKRMFLHSTVRILVTFLIEIMFKVSGTLSTVNKYIRLNKRLTYCMA